MRIKYYIYQLALLFSLSLGVDAQDNTLYYLQGAPQRYYTNPASQPQCNFFLGAPIFSSFQFKFETTNISADQFYVKDAETDSIYQFYDRTLSLHNFIDKLDEINYISNELSLNLASFGFRVKKMYFTLDWSLKSFNRIAYPKELVNFIGSDIVDGHSYNLNALNIDFTSYSEIAFGISRQFNEQWSLGIRPKLLFGHATVSTSNSEFQIDTRLREWNTTAKADLNICLPGINIPVNGDGIIDFDQEFEFDSTIEGYSGYKKLITANKGFGIDAGLNFRPHQRVELSLSIVDLGFIKWNKYTHTVALDGQYDWEGITVNSNNDTLNFNDYILDTLQSSFRVTGSGQSFKTYLSSKAYIGGRFFLTPAFDIGLLSRIELFKRHASTNIHLVANWRPSTVFGISTSYGLLDGSYSTYGLGFTTRIGPFNLYIVTDDIPTSYNILRDKDFDIPLPRNMYSYNIRFGLNLVFGCNKVKKLMKDKPMYYSLEY